jgi:hypothetical protein
VISSILLRQIARRTRKPDQRIDGRQHLLRLQTIKDQVRVVSLQLLPPDTVCHHYDVDPSVPGTGNVIRSVADYYRLCGLQRTAVLSCEPLRDHGGEVEAVPGVGPEAADVQVYLVSGSADGSVLAPNQGVAE